MTNPDELASAVARAERAEALVRKFANHKDSCWCFICKGLTDDDRSVLAEIRSVDEKHRTVRVDGTVVGECKRTSAGRWRAQSAFLVVGGVRNLGLHPSADLAVAVVLDHVKAQGLIQRSA